jgi:hypothetical protein
MPPHMKTLQAGKVALPTLERLLSGVDHLVLGEVTFACEGGLADVTTVPHPVFEIQVHSGSSFCNTHWRGSNLKRRQKMHTGEKA